MSIVLKPENVVQLVFFIRGEKVLLDADLAMLYGVEPRVLNQAVARNRKRFPADFMFQVSAREYDALTSQIVISDKDDARGASALRSQIVISKKGRGGRRYLPYAFTEQGVAMLSSVLRSARAVEVNTTCGDAVGWTVLSVWETGERSGERESTSPSCAHSCSCAGSWTRIAISLARSKRLRRNTTRNSRWSSKRSSNSLLRPSQNRPGAESGFTSPKSLSTLVSPRDVAKLYVLPSTFSCFLLFSALLIGKSFS